MLNVVVSSGHFKPLDEGRAIVPSTKAETADDGRVLQGISAFYNRAAVIGLTGESPVIRPGVSERRRVELWLDHSPAMTIGSTSDGLELFV